MNVYKIDTKNIQAQSLSISTLRKDASVFYSENYEVELKDENLKVLSSFLEDESRPVRSAKNKNSYLFKTPLDIVFATGIPEIDFIDYLCKREIADCIDSWIKSRDSGFYSLEYSWKKNSHQIKNQQFNPDFFIKMHKDNKIYYLVVEIKSDRDDCEENKAKYKYAVEHFENLNQILEENNQNEEYIFHFLSPNAYSDFFDYVKNQKILEGQDKFRCELENLLDE